MHTYIFQPIIPKYRIPLFEEVNNRLEGKLTLIASDSLPEDKNASSAVNEFIKFKFIKSRTISLFGMRIFWQSIPIKLRDISVDDTIIISGNPRYLSSIFLLLFCKLKGVKVIWWGQGFTAKSKVITIVIRQKVMKLADKIFLYTEKEKENYIKEGFTDKQLVGLNNSLDNTTIHNEIQTWDEEKLAFFKENFGLTKKKIILFCGRLTEKTNIEFGLKAFEKSNLGSEWLFVVIGDGFLKKNLELKFKNNENIWFLGQKYEEKDLAPWFLSASFFVYPGSIGLSLLHAFNYGLPVITHDNDRLQMPEIAALTNNVNGLRYHFLDINSLTACIQKLAFSEELTNKFSHNAFNTIKQDYNLHKMVSKFIDGVETNK